MELEIADPSSLPGRDDAKTAFWKQHVDAWQDSKLTQRAYAKRHGLTVARFVYWKNKLRPNPRKQQKQFVPVRVTATQYPVRLIHPGGLVIECQILFWEDNGFCLYYKRLEQKQFHWPRHLEDEVVTLTGQQLNWLLDGLNLKYLMLDVPQKYSETT